MLAKILEITKPDNTFDIRPENPTTEYCLLPGYHVRWLGEPLVIQPILWQLLYLILGKGGEDVDFREVDKFLYTEDEGNDSRIQKRVSELNLALEGIQLPWTFATRTTMVEDGTKGKIIYVAELHS
jgi:hypothetical protein